MNTAQVAKMTGIPEFILIRMRTRDTRTLKNGPPFHKKLGKKGETIYYYTQSEVKRWMKMRNCLITAMDAALILDSCRLDILDIYGLKSIPVCNEQYSGKLVIDNSKNFYLWIPKKQKILRVALDKTK